MKRCCKSETTKKKNEHFFKAHFSAPATKIRGETTSWLFEKQYFSASVGSLDLLYIQSGETGTFANVAHVDA